MHNIRKTLLKHTRTEIQSTTLALSAHNQQYKQAKLTIKQENKQSKQREYERQSGGLRRGESNPNKTKETQRQEPPIPTPPPPSPKTPA